MTQMKRKVAIIGLGYVGLPLAVEFAKKYPTVGFDIDTGRINELREGSDRTLEVESEELTGVTVSNHAYLNEREQGLYFSDEESYLESCDFYVITVPTPTDKNKRPDLTPLIKASECVGQVLKNGDYVVYESTVYPGVTEDTCVPVLEGISGLKLNKDFFVGYSPERINPGDKKRSITKIIKVTSGSTPKAAQVVDKVYRSIISAGTHLAPSIKVAEASKVIENSQRDINIAFVNELSKIFDKLEIDTHSVLEAAGTKWNFLPFKPGLVGGHCIGVDPYYLAQKAQESGYYPEIILAGRRINDSMGTFVASKIMKKMLQKDISIKGSKTLLLGFTFKENCPDVRNTRVIDIYQDLLAFGMDVTVYDPWVNLEEVKSQYGISVITDRASLKGKYSSIILAVAHDKFMDLDFRELRTPKSVLFDLKAILPINKVDCRL
jgi:UDP-N-acetyl-D-glucosamine/UDP-N-acetyl-D-galactosamine dehydrogenase